MDQKQVVQVDGDNNTVTQIQNPNTATEFFQHPTNVVRAFFALLLTPHRCFEEDEDGYLRVNRVSGFSFWLTLYCVEMILVMVATTAREFFNIWFFVVYLAYGIPRILITALIWIVVGLIILKNVKYVASICFFSVAVWSLPYRLSILPFVYSYGLPSLFDNETIINFESEYVSYFLVFNMLVTFLSWVYAILFLMGSLKISCLHSCFFLIFTQAIYQIIRPYIIVPARLLFHELFETSPWIG